MDGSITVNFENEALNMVSKVVLTHADMNMDVNHAITQALRRKRQADDSNSHHTLNVDITSPTFIDANLRYAAGKDGISASVSTPSSGFMGIQFNGRVPSQMSARVYGRYPSAPEDDVEVLVIRSSSMDADKMNLQIAYNMEAPKVVLSELKTRIPSIISAFTMFADKYQITSYMDELRNSVVNRISEAYEAAINYDSQMSQLSIFFRNIIVQYQKTVQVFIDAVVKVLRETQFKLPESDEMTTLPEVLKKLTSSIATMLDSTLQIIYENIEVSFNAFVEQISSVKMRMPVGDAITGGQILDQVKTTFKTIFAELVDFVKHMESVDTMLEKIGETLKAIVEKSQEFADSVKSDYLDAVFIYINVPYVNFVTALKNVVDHISALNIEQLNHSVEYIIDMFVHVVDQFNNTVNGFLQQASADAQALNRDLSRCDKFVPLRDHTSPLALISGMHYPLAQLVRSSQACNYKFDNENKHMTSGSCIENHILIPFSHNGEHGITNVGKQELTLVQVSPSNEIVFDHSGIVKGLHMDAVEDKSAIQDKDAGLNLLRELASLPETDGEKRAHLFHVLVSMVRGMKTETLSPAIPEALEVSSALTYQVLVQCGTPECSSAIMQIFRTFDTSSLEVDAGVFAMGLVSNPSALLINDMLEMAKYKPSKPIMYALSNVVKRFYKAEGKLIPEIFAVAEFMGSQLGDCSGDKDHTFMTLRVIGNMAAAMGAAGPALRSAVIQCVNQPAASLAVQQAAIQAFRLTPVPEEGREILMQVLLDGASPMQKRIAAYLVLMKDPQPTELAQLADALPNEQDQQVKSFVISHVTNILSSTEPATQELRQKILDALQGNEVGAPMDPTKFSRNYKIGSVEGNMFFEGSSYLPKEVMLEMTLKAFGYDIDMMEVGMEGNGFEPTVEALFGKNGFFPDTALETMYFVSENMPLRVNEILQNMLPALKKDRKKRQASQNLMREIGRNLNKLVNEMKTAQSPEAMVYLRLLGNELGYLKTNEMEELAYSAAMMVDSMFKMFPTDIMKALMTKADNTIFAHYIFMDNEFFLPTATGVPLRITMSGTFTPGIKGGLQIARDMSEVTFMPSAGIEFVSEIGSHIPEYINSGLEMHTNIFHESGLSAKISMESDNVKLTIPAPTRPTKLIKMTNTLVAVTGSEVKTIPPMVMDKVDVSECTPFFAGMKYCTDLQYTDAFSHETAPFFPITGDSKFAVELHPTGEVTEYTATIAYELLREGEEGRQKVDSVKFVLRAEGAEPTEARAIMKYNRRKNVITADIQIPDYDVEAGLRLGVVDGNTKGKGTHSISLDLINKNIPQLSLVGRANLKEMKEAMLQVQLLVPSINADATFTANMKRDEELELELKSEIKVMAATSEQNIAMKYDASKFEVEFKSDVNTETTSLPIADMVDMYGNQLLDIQVGQTEMKVRQIFNKFAEETNNYMEKHGDEFHYIKDFRVPDMPEISLPETLFLKTEGKAVYHFNNEHFSIAIPLPLGGKSTEELNFPPALTTPSVSLPQFGLEIVSMEIPIPELVVPESLTLSIPLFGKAEISTLMKSNLYEMEASMAAGKDIVDTPSYSAKFDVRGTSPVDILSFTMTGHDGTTGMNAEEISAHSDFKGDFTAGPVYGKTISTQSFAIFPFRQEAKIDSTVQLESTLVKAQNIIAATLANGELSVASNTNAFEDHLTHVAELSFKDSKLSLKSDANAVVLGMKIHNQAEASAGAGEVVMRMETNADHTENRVYSLLTASLDVNGLAVNSDATIKLLENEATHKATLKMNKDGLTTSGTNTLQSPLSLENTFNAGLDASTATLSIANKAAIRDIKVDNANTLTITLSSLDFNSKAEATASEYASYTHDITINLKPYTASANVNNNLNVLAANFINEAQLQAELYKMDLTGNLKAIYGEEEIKLTYQVNYADMTANAKCSTIGKLFGTHMSHNTELEVVGLAARITNDARFNSQPFRFDHTIRCSIVPFDFNLDAIFNADGDMTMYGKHSAQLYGKFLLKAQPLAFASSHECRASVNQQLDNGFALETTLDNKMDTVLSPQEQKTSFRMKSKLNEHAFNQDMSVYNTAERTGIEVSGTFLTNMFNAESTENQEFTISSFLKYDKITECQIILFPLIETLPAFLESVKVVVVRVAEALQDYINNEEIKAKLEALPQYVSDFVSQLNVEGKVTQMKQYFDDLTQEYVISMEDVEASLTNLKVTVENLLADLSVYIHHFAGMLKDIIVSGNLPETLIQKIQEQLNAINEEYDIQAMVLHVIDTMRELIQQINLEKLTGSSISFLQDLDSKYDVKAKLQTIMSDVKQIIETFDLQKCVVELKDYISSIEFKAYIDGLVSRIPTEIFNEIVFSVKEIIQDLDILGKINNFYAKMRELIVKFEVDKKVQAVLEKAVEFIHQLKIEETISAVVNKVKDADIPTKLVQVFQDAINYLKTTQDLMESLREIKVAEMIKSVKDVIDKFVLDIVKPLAEFIKEEITNLNVNAAITTYLDFVSKYYTRAITKVTELLTSMVEMIKNMAPEQKIINEIQQIVEGLIVELKKAELNILSFTLPLTDLVVPSVMLSMDKLGQFEIPTQLDIPEFTILGLYTIQATTISFEDIKQRIIELIEFIGNFEIKMIDVDAFFGDLTMNYLPSMPEMSFPEISLPEISFPTIPQVPVEKLVKSLQVPEITLPTIPTQIMVPCFGKLYGEIKFETPIYTVKTSAEFQNSTEKTLKFSHVNLGVEHQASVTLYGQSAQFNVRNEAEAPIIKNSLMVASGHVNLYDLKAELKANHDTELYGEISGVLSNGINIVVRPVELIFDFQNKGNAKIPSVGNLITELSVKSAILNLNVNAGLYAEEDLVFRLGATTASVFEGLKAKLDGTTSLTTRRGIKLANSLSLENSHIEGTHDSTISMSTETFETVVSVSTVAKIALPILNLEANQNVVADTKTNANAVSTFRMTGDFNLPLIKAVGKAEVDHSLKLEGSFLEVSMESTNKANMDGTVLEDYILLGLLDNDFNLYLNNDGLRSTSKIIADAKLNQGTNKVIEMDVNENLAVEASLSRVYAVLKYTGNNEANLLSFSTNGKHVVQATIDLAPASSLTADIEIDMSQPNTLGDLTIFGKTVAEVTAAKQKISTNGKFVSPLYTTNVAAEVEGDGPVFKVTLKSSATSVIVLLDYDMDGSITVNFENEALNMVSKVVLTHADMNMDVNHAITQALRRKRQADDSNSHHTLNVDITSPTFIDANLRYAAGKDGISASVSTPSSGFMGIQFNGRVPSQMSARVYGRYPSAPEDDVEVLVIRSSSMDADKMNLQIAYNMEAPKVVLSELKTRIPSIISAFTMFADKYQITSYMDELRNSVVNRISEAYEAAINYDSQMSQLSIFFRNIIVQYQKTVQVFIDAVVKVLRETQFKLPESDEMTTLPEVLKKLTSSIATMLDSTLQIIYENIEVSFNAFVEQISSVKMRMPVGDAITGGQILDQVKTTFKTIFAELVDFVKHMESVDTMLEKIGETLKAIVEKSQEFADSVKSDYLDAVFIYINVPYVNFVTALKNVVDHISALNIEQLNHSVEYIIDMFVHVVDQFNNTVNGFLQQASADAQAYIKVSIEVPQTCSFIVRTTGCSLSEVVDMDTEGNPVFAPAASSDAFAAEMERYPLKVVVEGVYDVKLYPEEGETTTILNIKRGIISALAVPLLEEDKNKNMHYPLAQLVRSSQACNYKFDNENKHMTSGSCIENHILIPFSHNGEHGITNVGKQELTLVQVSPSNEIVFDHSGIVKGLHMDAVEDKSAIQDKDAGLNLLRELASLPETDGEKRAHLFHVLVSMVRGMKTETLSPAIPEALEVSSALTYQVLVQCGTPECSSAIMQIFRTFDTSSLEVDAGVFAMGLVSNPSALLINDMLEMAKYKPSKPIMYALSNVVKRFYKAEGKLIPEIFAVAEFMGSQLGDCSGDKDHTFMTLRVIGNMAAAMGAAGPALRSAVIQCVNQPAASLAVQQAAIQAFRLTPVPEEGREILMQVLLDGASPMQKRIAAYLVLMKDPQPTELAQLADALPNEQDQQVKSFVISHVTNILSSTEPATQELRQKILDALQGNEVGAPMDPTKFSRNYKIGSVEGNMFFEGSSYLPKEVMLEMTLKAFGYDIDMMEVGMEGNGFEPTVEALFGKNGFFPDTALETMYFVSENMPLRVNEILQNMLPALKKDRKKRQASQNLMREIGRNLNKLVNEMKTAQSPEAMVYLRLLGNELGYLKTNEMEELAYSAAMMVDSMFKMFPTDIMKALMTKADNTIFAHYIFMDNEFFLPTATGVPLRITMSGTFTPGIKGGLQIARDMSEVTFMPSAGIEFVSEIGSHIPEYINSG
ncbi:Apolipoprotein B-100 [Dissostichus eleginoides]|uniref:Apolipoprotein B-100 n=1 Tax=Dissostichus eleginoides TaxID=100907 RepID=A0AAD9B1K1_DISEL|nr:Apolipoprotein B-100 [Dissostichus eleginoides]